MHLSHSSHRIVSDDFKNVGNDYFHQNCHNFPGSVITCQVSNGCSCAFVCPIDYTAFTVSGKVGYP